jgi:serine-type D-Ala-D-Ala endopeptidase (penicillin-binding protein 7)
VIHFAAQVSTAFNIRRLGTLLLVAVAIAFAGSASVGAATHKKQASAAKTKSAKATKSAKVSSKAGKKSAHAVGKSKSVQTRAQLRSAKASKRESVRASAGRPGKLTKAQAKRTTKKQLLAARRVQQASMVVAQPERVSFGQAYGLHSTADELELKSSVALVLDQDTKEVLFSKNSQAVLPIASLTKLMTALVVTENKMPLNEVLSITQDDVDLEKGSRSRLLVGTQLTREQMLHLALMSSENRAANALGRSYPGGLSAFVVAMNRKAADLGMRDTHYVEPTGLSSSNQSSARDLATLVNAAHRHRIIRELSTSPEFQVEVGNHPMQFRNTNRLIANPSWEIGLQKTGYITEAGRCLVMQAKMAGRQLIMIFLDSSGKYSRLGDAERVRKWMTESAPAGVPLLSVPSISVPSISVPKVTL